MPEVPRPLPLNELNLPSGSHIIVKTALAFVRIAWSVKINGEPAPGSRSRGGLGPGASPQRVQRQPKPLDGFLALWLRRNCDEQQQRSEYLEVCHP